MRMSRLARMLKNRVAIGTSLNGTAMLFMNDKGKRAWSFNPAEASRGDEWEEIASLPFCILVTGDLAFYAMLLGKENENVHHCPLCKDQGSL